MHTLVKIALVLAIILQADLIHGSRSKRATVNRAQELRKLVAASKTILSIGASQEQLTQLKRDITRCVAKNLTAVLSVFSGGLGTYINPFLGGRRRRDVNNAQESQPVSNKIDLDKEPQTRTQDINAIMAKATKLFKSLSNDYLVLSRQLVESLSGNMVLRYPFMLAALSAISTCANTNTSG